MNMNSCHARKQGIKSHHFLTAVYLLVIIIITPQSVVSQTTPDVPSQYENQRIPTSVALVIIILLAALFSTVFLSSFYMCCRSNATMEGEGGGIRGMMNMTRSRRTATVRGLDQAVIESFPTFVYSEVKNLKIGKGALECAVCLNEFENDETLRLIPQCDHVFHPECIDAWLYSHTTCPVCRAKLTPPADDLVEPGHQPGESDNVEVDLEAQNINTTSEYELVDNNDYCNYVSTETNMLLPEVINMNETLNRNRTLGSRSVRSQMKFPRSHTTGHSLVQPGENTERFTLRLPEEVRKQIMSRKLDRTVSMVLLPRERSSRRGFRNSGEDSSRGRYKQPERSDHRVFGRSPSFLARASSILARGSTSARLARAASKQGEGTSSEPVRPM